MPNAQRFTHLIEQPRRSCDGCVQGERSSHVTRQGCLLRCTAGAVEFTLDVHENYRGNEMKAQLLVVLALAAIPGISQAESRPATSAEIELVREGMQDRLKDADSAKFRNVRFGSGDESDTICGDVNAKNSFGAYDGYSAFLAMYIGPEDYEDSATVKHKPSVYVLAVDSEPGGAAAMTCADKGI